MLGKIYLDKNCPYCSLLQGKIENALVLYRDELVTAFLSHMPVNQGHAIVIPNSHFVNPSSIPEEVGGRMYFIASRIGVACKRALDSSGFNIMSSDGFCAGQDIQHAHIHIIPRYLNDGWHLNWRTKSDKDIKLTFERVLARLKTP